MTRRGEVEDTVIGRRGDREILRYVLCAMRYARADT
jgi:hypothetical protein